ncbi:MAG: TIGR00266 family protein [Deltaproteobacteria bacterium]|nr:TIGR00266 family protein [Deltaproteobacteria bacterium]
MRHSIEHGPSFAWLRVTLEPGETVFAEAGSMVARTPEVAMTTRLNAGLRVGFFSKVLAFFVALLRKVFGGETMFVNEFGGPSGGQVVLAPQVSGNVVHEQLEAGKKLFVQAQSYLASTGDVEAKVRWGGLRTLFGGEGLFLLECAGSGDLFITAYGGIHPISVDGSFVVDSGHVVAFDGTLDFRVRSAGGLKSFFFSGEGLVCEFKGHGRVFVQSRNIKALVGWISPLLRS